MGLAARGVLGAALRRQLTVWWTYFVMRQHTREPTDERSVRAVTPRLAA